MMSDDLIKEFRDRFHKDPDHIFFCPGRVNIIGEHIDYNGGRVMPCAISLGTWLAVSINKDRLLRFHCLDFPETIEFPLQSSYQKTGNAWFNYPLGVIDHLVSAGHTIEGMDLLFAGNLPIGAGLSSSASIEVLTTFAISTLFSIAMPTPKMALLAQEVENHFIGLHCGIMDQFAVAMGKQEQAILLDCDSLRYEYLPFDIGEYTLAIINTNKPRKLSESKYNERFAECRAALALLQTVLPIEHLCDISLQQWEEHKAMIQDPVLQKRVGHVVSENERVKAAASVLQSGNLLQLGQLLFASHASLQYAYEVSGIELDTIVEYAQHFPGCIGARMTGAGFGGCAIALVRKDRFDAFAEGLSAYYQEKIGYAPGVFGSAIGDGVRQLQ